MNPFEWGLLLILSVLWGGSFFFTEVAVTTIPPFTLVVLRVGIAALVLAMVIRAMGQQIPMTKPVWRAFIGMGVLNNVIPFCLIVWGQTHIASSLAAILNATTPMFTVLVAHALTADEKMTRARFSGMVVGFGGVVVLVGPDALADLGANTWAQVAVLGAAASYAFAGVYGRRFKALKISPLQTATGQVMASALLLLPVALFVDRPWMLTFPSLSVWSSVIGLAVLSTALAYILYFRILETAGATNLLLVTFLIPVSAIALGVTFLGEVLETKQILGMVIIGGGLVLIDGRIWQMTGSKSN
jgi:drug/metabolite transporter (DMT)-like permease